MKDPLPNFKLYGNPRFCGQVGPLMAPRLPSAHMAMRLPCVRPTSRLAPTNGDDVSRSCKAYPARSKPSLLQTSCALQQFCSSVTTQKRNACRWAGCNDVCRFCATVFELISRQRRCHSTVYSMAGAMPVPTLLRRPPERLLWRMARTGCKRGQRLSGASNSAAATQASSRSTVSTPKQPER